MRVAKWGNSLAVRLPASLVEEMGLKEGSSVELRAANKTSVEVSRLKSREEALESLRRIGAKLPKGYKFDREEANAR